MSPAKKVRPSRQRRHTRKWLIALSAFVLIVSILTVSYLWYPKNSADSKQTQSTAFQAFTDHYTSLMKNLNSSETKTKMMSQLDPNYNQTDLFIWEAAKLNFTQDLAGWYEDPIQILSSGKGICVQWSIVYVSACLALGHQSRLVVAADTTNWSFIHTWAEDYYNGTWVHVDPSDKVWNTPSRYQTWDWGAAIGSGVKIYAFEDDGFEEVTANYCG